MGEEDRDASTAAKDLRSGGKRKEEVTTVEGGILRRRNEASAAEPVRRLSSGVFAGEGANQRVPRGKTTCRIGALLARTSHGCHVSLAVLE